MKELFSSRLIKGTLSVIIAGVLTACAGPGVGQNYVPGTFQDDGGVDEAVSSTMPGQYLAGRQALREQDTEAAYNFFNSAYQFDNTDNFLLQNNFRTALANGNLKEAIIMAQEIVRRDLPKNDTAHLVLALENIRQGAYDDAAKRLSSIKLAGFNILLKPVLNAWVLVGQGDLVAANKELDGLDNFDGFKLLKSYHQALLAHASGQTELARSSYEKALKGPSGRAVRLIQSYGIFLLEQGETEQATALFKDYKKRYPLSPTVNHLLDQIAAGTKIAPLISNPAEGAAEALYSSAAIIGQQQANGAAVNFAYFALMLRPELTVANILLAEIAEDRRQAVKALAFYAAVPDSSPYALNARIRTAWLTYQLGDAEKAVSSLKKLITENPQEVEPVIVLADLNRDKKDWAGAARAYGTAIDNIGEAKARLWSLHYARGIAYERLGEWEKAEADLLTAMELRPNHPQILNYLGYSWADRGEKLDEAKDLLIKAVSLRPRDGYIVDSLGWLYYRLADYENAALQLENAVSLQPEDPTINDHLGDAYWRVGRQEEAQYQWQRALWLSPEENQIPLIEKKLKDGLPPTNGATQ
jgi:Flp pilus assembly protein TadD